MLLEPALGLLSVAFGTVPIAAGMITELQIFTVVTAVKLAPQSCRAAGRQIVDRPPVTGQQVMTFIIGRRMTAQNIGYFEHKVSQSVGQLVNGSLDCLTHLLGQVGVNGGGRWCGVAEGALDKTQIDPGLQKMGGVAMA